MSYSQKEATVTFNPNQVDFEQMKKALVKTGYVATMPDGIQQILKIGNVEPGAYGDFPSDDLVCYCFGYTRHDIEQDYIENGQSNIMARIATEKKAGGCDCAVKNPRGR